MSRPVDAIQWAGTLDCTVCKRQRLQGTEFSPKMLQNHRQKDKPLKCKQCVEEGMKAEQEAARVKALAKAAATATAATAADGGALATATAATATTTDDGTATDAGAATATATATAAASAARSGLVLCGGPCALAKPAMEFNNTQLKKAQKGLGEGRCRVCVEAASVFEVAGRAAAKEKKMTDARARVAAAEKAYSTAKDAKNSGATAAERLAANAALCALEAELVTGLKPMRLGRGRSRGRGR